MFDDTISVEAMLADQDHVTQLRDALADLYNNPYSLSAAARVRDLL